MKSQREQPQAEAARSIFLRALAGSTVDVAFARDVSCDGRLLRVASQTRDLRHYSGLCIVSIGKAGTTLFDALAAILPAEIPRTAIVVAPAAPLHAGTGITFFSGGHPGPNAASIASARAILAAIEAAAPRNLVVFLISGGASSMCELPLTDAVSLADLTCLYRLLVGSGATIAEINCVRKHLSRVKGGRLAVAAGAREKLTLLVSDVPADALDALGSGPTLPDTTTVADCRKILARYDLLPRLPLSIQSAVHANLPESPKPDDPAFLHAATHLLLDNQTLLHQAEAAAISFGYETLIDNTCDDWDYVTAADYLLRRLERHCVPGRKFCLLSGGEVTVRLPPSPGKGGRNQHFALYCALQPLPPGVTVLSAGTDGIDGHSPAAGALADATTLPRAIAAGVDPAAHLRECNSFPLFAAIGDDLITGPTGNNLRDLRLLLWDGRD